MKTECTNCHQHYEVEDEYIGQEVECTQCGATFVVKAHRVANKIAPFGRTKAKTYCAKCGAPNVVSSQFCASCGAGMHGTENRTNPLIDLNGALPAGSWIRCGARTLDVLLETFVLGVIVGIIGGTLSLPNEVLAIVFLPFALVLDSIVHAIFGTTFGKWLFGIKVVDLLGAPVSAGRYFYRNLRVWWGGYGLGLPIVCLITGSVQQYRILKGKPATYDQALGLNSIRYNATGLKTLGGVVLLILLLVPVVKSTFTSVMRPAERNKRAMEERMRMKDEISQLRMSAEQGDAEAQNLLGVCYENGQGVEQDYEEAARWYRKSAEQGFAMAQANLGGCYYFGNGVEQDYREAVKWFRKAAEQGVALAQRWLGNCYLNGAGVEQDKAEAVKWLRKAADQGEKEAKEWLEKMAN